MIRDLDRLEVTRRELGAALSLFIEDRDPVAVHVLACAGAENADYLAALAGRETFLAFAGLTFPHLARSDLVGMRNRYCNAFKHPTRTGGKPRDDTVNFESFSDEANASILFVGWYDYMNATRYAPIEAQAFQAWFFAAYPGRLNIAEKQAVFDRVFPGLPELRPSERKRRLVRAIEKYRNNREIMMDPRTERRRLLLLNDR